MSESLRVSEKTGECDPVNGDGWDEMGEMWYSGMEDGSSGTGLSGCDVEDSGSSCGVFAWSNSFMVIVGLVTDSLDWMTIEEAERTVQ